MPGSGGRPGRATMEWETSEGTRASHLSGQDIQKRLRGMSSGTTGCFNILILETMPFLSQTMSPTIFQQTTRWTQSRDQQL